MLKKIDNFFIKLQRNIGGIVFLIVFACCLCQVIFRYVIHIGAPWTEEFSRVGLAYMTFLMSALGIRQKAHPSVDFLVKKLPDRIRFAVEIFVELLIGLVGAILLFYGWQFLLRTLNDLSTTYHYSKAWWYWPIPVSGAIMVVYAIRNVCYLVISIIKNQDVTGGILSDGDEENVQPLDLDENKEDNDL